MSDCEEDFSDFARTVMVDQGSDTVKAGFADERSPSVVASLVSGRPRRSASYVNCFEAHQKTNYFGNHAQSSRGILTLKQIIQNGRIQSWDAMEKMWQHLFDDLLNVDFALHEFEQRLLLSEPCVSSRMQRERIAETMFESFELWELYLGRQGILSVFGTGSTTGLCVDIGDGLTQVTPVWEGYMIPDAQQQSGMAGDEITKQLDQMMQESAFFRLDRSLSSKQIVRKMKEEVGFVKQFDCGNDDEKIEETVSFELPDGESILVGSQRHECAECLFNPSLIGKECVGIQHLVWRSVLSCPVDVRKDLCQSVVLGGGTANMRGLESRLIGEIKSTNNVDPHVVKVDDDVNRSHLVWVGGAVLASVLDDALWVSKEEYEEYGARVVAIKCF